MKEILIPVDFSDVSENALTYALSFAKLFNAEIKLLHAYHTIPAEPEIPSESDAEELEQLRLKAEKSLNSICSNANETFGSTCSFVNQRGYAKEIIVNYVNEHSPDLMVMGTESINPIDKIIFGTVTGKVLKKVTCPILVVPEDSTYQIPRKMAFAIDYHDNDLEDLKVMMSMAQKFNSELHVLRVATDRDDLEFEDRLMTDFKHEVDHAIPNNDIVWHLLQGKNVVDQLEKYVKDEQINLIAASKSKLSPFLKIFLGSTTQKLFYHTHIPLLIFQAEDAELRSEKLSKRSSYE